MNTNVLYYGDNLEIMRNRDYFPDESVDLVYLDPPFNSSRNYNILFKESDQWSEAQVKAFGDTWHWTQDTEKSYREFLLAGPLKVGKLIEGMVDGPDGSGGWIGRNDVAAYLVMMAPRLVELQRVLKQTGSLYLHCDPTASHYLKLVLDQVFGPTHFRNEIVWKRTSAHSGAKRWSPVHDVIFYYAKSERFTWNSIFGQYGEKYLDSFYRFRDEGGRYRLGDLTGAGTRSGDSGKPWRGVDPTTAGRHWAVPNRILREYVGEHILTATVQEKLDALDQKGLIYWPPKGKTPQLKRYFKEDGGVPILDVVADINPIGAQAAERLGYPTQKPLALLERIIEASSNSGDVVLDPFCGCGTAIVAAQKLNRKWIGIDITQLAIAVMENRLKNSFGLDPEVIGDPVALEDAANLAKRDRYQFQWWALKLVKARPVSSDNKKGADKGIDGFITFPDDHGNKVRRAIVQVKSGHVSVKDVRELKEVSGKEALGIFISLKSPTKDMEIEALGAGQYHSPLWDKDYPKIQIVTVEELLHGKTVNMPPAKLPYAQAARISPKGGEQLILEARA